MDLARRDGVETGRRLVEEQHLGIAQQRSRQRRPLPQSLGQGAARVGGSGGQVHRGQGSVDACARPGHLVQVSEALEVLAHAQAEIEPR